MEVIRSKGLQAAEEVSEEWNKKGTSAYMQVFFQDLCVCMAFDYTGSSAAYFKSRLASSGKNVAALLLMFKNTAVSAKVGTRDGEHDGFGYFDFHGWSASFLKESP